MLRVENPDKKVQQLRYEVNTLKTWEGFVENYNRVMRWEEYLKATGFDKDWEICTSAPTK